MNISEIQNKYLNEIQQLNLSLLQFKRQTEDEIDIIKFERNEFQKKHAIAEKEIVQCNN